MSYFYVTGVIGLATAVFPSKIKGNCLDSLARKHLWDVGLDYLHGTSHGVGAFLNVHEGPMGISWRVYPNDPGSRPCICGRYLGIPKYNFVLMCIDHLDKTFLS